MALEVDPAGAQELDGGFGVHVFGEVEVEVEDPRAGEVHQVVGVGVLRAVHAAAQQFRVGLLGGEFAFGIPERDADLDGFEDVDVAAQRLIVVLGLAVPEAADRPRDDAGEFRVHRDVGVFEDELAQHRHFLLEVVPPDFADAAHGSGFYACEARFRLLVAVLLHGGAAREALLRGYAGEALPALVGEDAGGEGGGAGGAGHGAECASAIR